jgi:hypothetical protein
MWFCEKKKKPNLRLQLEPFSSSRPRVGGAAPTSVGLRHDMSPRSANRNARGEQPHHSRRRRDQSGDVAEVSHGIESLDLSPALATPEGFQDSSGRVFFATAIAFDELIGADAMPDPSALFTCERKTGHGLPPLPPRRAPWPHRRSGPARSALTFAEVGVGILIAGRAELVEKGENESSTVSVGSSFALAKERCEARGVLLACGIATWLQATPSLRAVGLVDCRHFGPTPQEVNGQFDGHSAFSFRRVPWLRVPNLNLRCYWGPTGKIVRNVGGFRKTGALFRALLETLPTRRYFLKVDEDTLPRPANLMRFLASLHAAAHPDTPLYFGTVRSREVCNRLPQPERCHMFVFNTRASRANAYRASAPPGVAVVVPMEDEHVARTVPLRENLGWRELEAAFLPPSVANVTMHVGISGVSGGGYGMNRRALAEIVRTRCIQKVGTLRCRGGAYHGSNRSSSDGSDNATRSILTTSGGNQWHGSSRCKFRRGIVHAFEDNAVGLCMHLTGVRPIHCEAFRSFLDSDPLRPSALADGTPGAALSRHVVLMHPIKQPREMLRSWNMLLERDRLGDAELEEWRRQASARYYEYRKKPESQHQS